MIFSWENSSKAIATSLCIPTSMKRTIWPGKFITGSVMDALYVSNLSYEAMLRCYYLYSYTIYIALNQSTLHLPVLLHLT